MVRGPDATQTKTIANCLGRVAVDDTDLRRALRLQCGLQGSGSATEQKSAPVQRGIALGKLRTGSSISPGKLIGLATHRGKAANRRSRRRMSSAGGSFALGFFWRAMVTACAAQRNAREGSPAASASCARAASAFVLAG